MSLKIALATAATISTIGTSLPAEEINQVSCHIAPETPTMNTDGSQMSWAIEEFTATADDCLDYAASIVGPDGEAVDVIIGMSNGTTQTWTLAHN